MENRAVFHQYGRSATMPLMKQWTITTLEELRLVAAELCQDLKMLVADKAAVLALHGDLGAGKTSLVQLLAKQLEVNETVTSPTFVIMKKYAAKDGLALIHIDAYRIEEIDEMRVLGFEDALRQKHTIICIEWAERISELLPANTIHLNLELKDGSRIITQN